MHPVLAFAAGAACAALAVMALVRLRSRSRMGRAPSEPGPVPRDDRRAYAAHLAGGLIHEVKNPLNTLHLNLQLLAEDWRSVETERERRALKRIERLQTETARLNGILDDFMRFLRDETLVRTPGDLNRLVEDLALFLRPAMQGDGIDLRVSLGELPRCAVDVNLVRQCLLNLLLNAQQVVRGRPAREIILRTSPEPGGARVDVIDTGPGIAPENLERIFEPFYSTRPGGTGLGLSISCRIAEEHGGWLRVHSEPGKGSCFSMYLPVGAADPASAPAPAAAPSPKGSA